MFSMTTMPIILNRTEEEATPLFDLGISIALYIAAFLGLLASALAGTLDQVVFKLLMLTRVEFLIVTLLKFGFCFQLGDTTSLSTAPALGTLTSLVIAPLK